ncbi:MAG: PSD1 domain-containing protein [Planctomycetaceae bacterium]|nr:PSD1 domain-containing protein [Planctomycetales bacterium]MCB9941241.1 PSD1 domain-containing protein [Planctomycetaceae bacterium]
MQAPVLLSATLFVCSIANLGWANDQQSVDFARDVRSILSANCFACHGPDEETREAELRLDRREDAIAERDGKAAIVPSRSKESELFRRITTVDADLRMPPPDSGHELTKEQIATIGKWIDQGAEYSQHWSFVKPTRPEVPRVQDAAAVKNPIDAFILARLDKHQLTLSKEADRYALIRRLSLDLTGLPPTPDEADAFVRDESPEAYERLVDRLLESNSYGEHWARMWLDLARYADTKGYEKDQPRDIWRYRDWVIEALNADMPYDRFTIEQLAGDLLPDATSSQQLATAFHRNTMTNDEGGTDNEEFRVLAVKDRVDTTMQVWMGLTMGCAKCHSHKYDPITMNEYYEFFAFFNQTEDADRPDDAPRTNTPTDEQETARAALVQQLAAVRKEYEQTNEEYLAARNDWEKSAAGTTLWEHLQTSNAVSEGGATLTIQKDRSILASGELPKTDTYAISANNPSTKLTAIRLEALTDESLVRKGPGRNGDDPNFVVNDFVVSIVRDGKPAKLALQKARADFSQNGWDVAGAIDDEIKTGWAISPQQGQPHVAVFDLSEPIDNAAGAELHISISQQYGNGLVLGRFRLSVSSADVSQLAPVLTTTAELAEIPADKRTTKQQQELDEAFRSVYPRTAKLASQIKELERQLSTLDQQIANTPIMRELAENRRRPTFVHVRGNFLEPGDRVEAGVPDAFGSLPEEFPRNRLGVAQWLMHPDNPLTARVAVNRVWARIFGLGIVETEEDFGSQGIPPSHPELLDWLAVEFRDSLGWSMKQLCKTIVMSATYRQSSSIDPRKQAVDPRNQWLSRAPRFRLPAETVRDQALAISGLLSPKMFGPSVMPPQPSGIWQTTYSQLHWATSAGEDRYRRGLYTFLRRTSPYPSMLMFDAGSREVCLIRRIRTNTPLQALVTLNDPVYVEAAGGLAMRVLSDPNILEATDRATRAFRIVLVRPPATEEIDRVVAFYETALADFQKDPAAVESLLESANVTPAANADKNELAAWIVVANALLNLDETLMRN